MTTAPFELAEHPPTDGHGARSGLPGWVLAVVGVLLTGGIAAAAVVVLGGGSRAGTHTGSPADPAVRTVPAAAAGGPSTTAPPRAPSYEPHGWPATVPAYTVALASDLTEGDARRAATLAVAHGLTAVGVLRSSEYRSLRPGYWFVFSGVYSSPATAKEHVSAATAAGFRGAYPRRVAR